MGKYQLDGKGKVSVKKFHEKQARHNVKELSKESELKRLKEKYGQPKIKPPY